MLLMFWAALLVGGLLFEVYLTMLEYLNAVKEVPRVIASYTISGLFLRCISTVLGGTYLGDWLSTVSVGNLAQTCSTASFFGGAAACAERPIKATSVTGGILGRMGSFALSILTSTLLSKVFL